MSIILSIETSTELASAALMHGAEVIFRESSGVQTHSQTILPMVRALLAEAGITLRQCNAIAFGSGPGSFTGVRTACGVVQGLAFGADLPVVPIVTLEAMAQACHETSGAVDILPVLDARMGEVYWGRYQRADDGSWTVLTAPTLSRPEDPAGCAASSGAVVACGNGLSSYPDVFSGRRFAPDRMDSIMPHARYVAHLASAEFAKGRVMAAQDAQPLYLRNKVALTIVERAAKAAA
jgi:tRNA threonylcarbamoyladenosine biosynthesis protein TsaB